MLGVRLWDFQYLLLNLNSFLDFPDKSVSSNHVVRFLLSLFGVEIIPEYGLEVDLGTFCCNKNQRVFCLHITFLKRLIQIRSDSPALI